MSIVDESKELKDYMVQIRRDLHQIPELGLKLPKTMAYIVAELERLGIRYEIKEDVSCIFAYIGEKPADEDRKCILLRADVDALAIMDKSGEPFAVCEGRMHACGHDMHGAALLGAARILKAHESELQCTVKLLFQSAEETFQGALAAIEAGVLENPKPVAAYASHVFAMNPLGHVNYGHIPMGAVYGFKITLTGVGGHGSAPEACIDPINAAVQVYLALQSLIAREVPATEEAALTIGQLAAGEAANIIPATAVLQGTLRTFNPDIKALVRRRINEIVPAVAAAYRCGCEIETLSDCPSVICDPEFSQYCINTMEEAGLITQLNSCHVMGSEDFAFVSELIPTCYLSLGACPADMEKGLGQHNPAIRFNEDALVQAAAAYALIAYNFH